MAKFLLFWNSYRPIHSASRTPRRINSVELSPDLVKSFSILDLDVFLSLGLQRTDPVGEMKKSRRVETIAKDQRKAAHFSARRLRSSLARTIHSDSPLALLLSCENSF